MDTDKPKIDLRLSYYSWPNYWEKFHDDFDYADELFQRFDEVVLKLQETIADPFLFDIILSDNIWMTVFVADEQWMLMLTKGPFDHTYTLGDEQAEGDIEFNAPGYELMSRKYFVPKEEAYATLREWVKTGELSPDVQWTTELF